MSTSDRPPIAQPVLTPLTSAAVFLVLTVRPGGEQQVRDVLDNIDGLQRAVGFRVPAAGLAVVAGISSSGWDRLFPGAQRPACLHPLPQIDGRRHRVVVTPGDVLLHIRAARMDLCFEFAAQAVRQLGDAVAVLDEVHGFKFFDERDLLGFVDGTENPTAQEAIEAVSVGDEDAWFRGGSYVVVQKYLHDLTAWNAISVQEQERVIGRSKLDDIEMPDDVKPSNSHVALTTITDPDGTERQILRDNMPFGRVGEAEYGTYFIGYAADPDVLERMLTRMFVGEPPGNYDRILDFSTPVTGGLFAVPTLDVLQELAASAPAAVDPPDAPAEPPADAAAHASDPVAGSLAIGDLRRRTATSEGSSE